MEGLGQFGTMGFLFAGTPGKGFKAAVCMDGQGVNLVNLDSTV